MGKLLAISISLNMLFMQSAICQEADRYEVIISELMADPDPPVKLPNVEYVEIFNRSDKTVSLKGWTLHDRTSYGTINEAFDLSPGQYVVLCAAGSAEHLKSIAETVIVTRFPSLDNGGDELTLATPNGKIIHSIAYHISWYKNSLKQNGGWSLEMIDPDLACYDVKTGSNASRNWTASISPTGGTPGVKNSVNELGARPLPFTPLHSYIDSNVVVITFNQPVRHNLASNPPDISITKTQPPPAGTLASYFTGIAVEEPWLQKIRLSFSSHFETGHIYNIELKNLLGCYSDSNDTSIWQLKTAIPEPVSRNDVIINEILFDPLPPGDDFVEIYNRGEKVVDLNKIWLSGKNTTGALTGAAVISDDTKLLFPGEYLAITKNPETLFTQFPSTLYERTHQINTLPSMPNNTGTICLLDEQGGILEEVNYNTNWHHPLLRSPKGVSLERIYTGSPGNEPSNWQSAAAATGYATPGYKNSQNQEAVNGNMQHFHLPHTIFSPDYNGYRDMLLIEYQLPENGWMGSVSIMTLDGAIIKRLAKQFLMGSRGFFKWDGTSDARSPMGTGHYIVLVECFNTQGKTIKWKKVCSLVRK